MWAVPAAVGQSPAAWGGDSSPTKLSFSPSKGFVSWRDTKSGSWYIETLDSVFEQWAHSEDLQSLLLRVSITFLQGAERLPGGAMCPLQGGVVWGAGRPKINMGNPICVCLLACNPVRAFASLNVSVIACGDFDGDDDTCPLLQGLLSPAALRARLTPPKYHGPGQGQPRGSLGPCGWGWGGARPSSALSSWAPLLLPTFRPANSQL